MEERNFGTSNVAFFALIWSGPFWFCFFLFYLVHLEVGYMCLLRGYLVDVDAVHMPRSLENDDGRFVTRLSLYIGHRG